MGQASQKGRYPIHWHLGDDRSGDVLRNSSVTNSNNRGVTIHGTSNLQIEGVVLHDIHGHGFFFEDAVETGNELVGNIAFGIHTVGGNDKNFANPGGKDPFVVDTHDSVTESGSRFESSAAFWITNPTNTFVGNIAAGAGDARDTDYTQPGPAGTGFWYAIPRVALGVSGTKSIYADVRPIYAEFGQFDYNSSHSTAVGLNFDRGEDIEDGRLDNDPITTGSPNNYSPRTDPDDPRSSTMNFINAFTNYKATGSAVYHRGQAETIFLNDLRVSDSYNGPWAVSETEFTNSLYVGHSKGNADYEAKVGGPRLYDGAGLHTNAHFAGFADADAFTFQVEGSSFGPTMYHAFREVSFEDDGTYGHMAHAVSDFQRDPALGHDLGQPYQWIKASMDLDGSLTSGVGGGAGYTIVPNIDFLVEDGDTQPPGWDAWLTNDIYARVKLGNNRSGEVLFQSKSTGEPLVRFTARDGDRIDVMAGQNNGNNSWTQIVAKTDGDGFVEGTFTVEFGKNGVPANGFDLNMKNQDGDRPALNSEIQAKVDAARIVVKIVAAGNYTPNRGTEVVSETALRSATSGIVYFRDDLGNLYFNTGIDDSQPSILLAPGDPLQTTYIPRKIEYGTTIEAEEFDQGIEGVAYHDNDSANTLGSFRSDTGVDATATKVGDIADGEWLEYTAEIVPAAYQLGVKVSSIAAGGQVRILAAISNSAGYLAELGTVDVPDTGGTFETVWLEGVDLAPFAGTESVIRLEFIDGGFEVDSVQFTSPTQSAYVDRTIAADLTTTRIELEEFDLGGQGVAYFDTTPGNHASDSYRTNEDVEATSTLITNQVFEGEWLEYTTGIEAGFYDITLRKAWGGSNTGVKLFIAASNSATEFTELGEFVFGGQFLTLNNIDLSPWAGSDRVIRIEIVGNWMGIDYLDFRSLDRTAPTADMVDVTPDPRNANAGVVTINFDEDVSGVDIRDLVLTRAGNAIDISGLTLTKASPRQYRIDLSTATAADGDYELRLNSTNSGIQDMAGNAFATDVMDQFVVDMTGPQVESVVVNDGSAQRSMVSKITVTFSEVVNGVTANSFNLMNTTTGKQVIPTVMTQVVNGRTVATLTFNGSGLIGGSLADGDYLLTTLASNVADAAGNQLDGNGDGASGDNATDSLFRLYGDVNGDRIVNIVDLFQFRNAYRGSYNTAFDFNGDGNINILDLFQFRSRYGSSI